MENLLFLGVPILKHIRVIEIVDFGNSHGYKLKTEGGVAAKGSDHTYEGPYF